jgi:hypothetical protein
MWVSGRPTVREVEVLAGTGWSKKRMPVAERRQETGMVGGLLQAGSRITGRIRDVVPGPSKGADVDQVSLWRCPVIAAGTEGRVGRDDG